MAHKTKIKKKIYYLALYRRSLPTPGLNEGAFKIMYPSTYPPQKKNPILFEGCYIVYTDMVLLSQGTN